MAKSLQQVLSQIEKLEKEAKALRAKEAAGVIERIREAIAHYELTPADLFGTGAPAGRRTAAPAKRRAAAKAGKPAASVAKYSDGAGRTWTGHGKRPNWFKDALAAGKTAEELLIKA
ncbi:MAG: histidine biosynthesis protein [Roseateles depolymerans]|uniref:Histidine biosynthesis protein n=1 Tax=Roseateles depolymerans TaxID=76731 RepID=A0A2W5FB02_9BURK|nr:MAG: histidine biosynthesis protein [Roseateles depolymerans]